MRVYIIVEVRCILEKSHQCQGKSNSVRARALMSGRVCPLPKIMERAAA